MKEIQYVLYSLNQEDIKVKVALQDETLWATQRGMAELFEVSIPTINEHLKNIYESNELDSESTIRNFRIVQTEGTRQVVRYIDFYNLDAVISVGYRVNSRRATQFRIWATKVLKEFMQKGFVLDDRRLKQGESIFGKDYFRELLECVRSIRASERRIWQQITDIFAECSVDYDKNSPITQEFYATSCVHIVTSTLLFTKICVRASPYAPAPSTPTFIYFPHLYYSFYFFYLSSQTQYQF